MRAQCNAAGGEPVFGFLWTFDFGSAVPDFGHFLDQGLAGSLSQEQASYVLFFTRIIKQAGERKQEERKSLV